ncbi:ATP-binding protein [Luteolibacter ambystomatis]|uniref:histidine kinase n=1 Tax=Luteolibacter ambystomatis TaxID=2824561 RepID=A0A975IXM6_9BACT|nr:ATP-binding protein [Luteolibacter ambystomatis]QUE49244.1 ATP-binding protein [Luteolibacter ambystomatis]
MKAIVLVARAHLDTSGVIVDVWDAPRLRQVVSNLLSNPAHHGDGNPISLSLRGRVETMVIEVRNSGKPNPGDALGTLFDPMVRFTCSENEDQHGSLGLGLYVCREIAVAHGGQIQAASSETGETSFTVTLPRESVASAGVVRNWALNDAETDLKYPNSFDPTSAYGEAVGLEKLTP